MWLIITLYLSIAFVIIGITFIDFFYSCRKALATGVLWPIIAITMIVLGTVDLMKGRD